MVHRTTGKKIQLSCGGTTGKKNPGKNSDLGAGSDAGQAAVRSSCQPPAVSAAAGGLAPVGFKHSCLYSHLETMASPSRPQACMVSHQDLLEMWEADVAVWDCWFVNQKKLYDAQSQEPDEMRRLHLANQQWVQEEEERREESQRKRRRTDVGLDFERPLNAVGLDFEQTLEGVNPVFEPR